MKRVLYWGTVMLVLGAVCGLQVAVDAIEAKSSTKIKWEVPGVRTLRLASFGFDHVISDYYWVKSLLYIMKQFDEEERDYSPLPVVYDTITDLDSGFGLAYHYGSVFVTALAREPEKSICLLHKGLRTNSKDWRVRWLLNYDIGSTYSVRMGQREKAESYYRAAALDPNCPPAWTKHIQKILSARADEPYREAFELWKRRLETARGPIMKQIAEQEMLTAQSNLYLEEVRKGVALFEERAGSRPEELAELVQAGIIQEIPTDPLGGTYEIDVDGEVVRVEAPQGEADGGVFGRKGRR